MGRQTGSRNPFLDIACTPALLDLYIVRTAVLQALKTVAPRLKGVILDVGSGAQPYKPFVVHECSNITEYIALDFKPNGRYRVSPDLVWDGETIPLSDNSVDCAIATEVFEHFPCPEAVMAEILRVLKPGGGLFFTVPFLWRLHDVPFDEYRYTPFSLERHLRNAGFVNIQLKPLGGPDASLGQILALWVKGRSRSRLYYLLRPVVSFLCTPIVWLLAKLDTKPSEFYEGCLITGLSGTAVKPGNTEENN